MIYFLLLLMTMLGTVAAVFFKKAAGKEILKSFFDVNLYIGVFLYLIAAVLNVYILKYLDYSLVLPMTSLTYIWTVLVSYLVFKEKIVKQKLFGVLLILVGAVFIAIN